MNVVVPVELGARAYRVQIGSFAPEAAAEILASAFGPAVTGVALLVDEGMAARAARLQPLVTALRARLPRVELFNLRAGETCKSLTEIERTLEWLAEQGYDRRAAVIGIGGGAATDHAGFAAAVYLRGIPFATVPTTLLAMVDASVGGKTGVDLRAGKNLVGAFHQPSAVIADLAFLDSLPARERTAGLAEVVKCGFIADPEILVLLERSSSGRPSEWLSPELLIDLITRAVRVKAEVVAADETEGGRRAILNFGHTVGHALESASGYDLLHGEAISLGMVVALDLGAAMGIGSPELATRARVLLEKLGLPIDAARRLDAGVLARLSVDKKRHGDQIRFVFCPAAGQARLVDISAADLAARVLSKA
ncbi:MAG TPA: 3-dehydroquinate synthase [Polyangia bacterium]|nr:3-dehydroquinate synthase [Polyangia bacterium]